MYTYFTILSVFLIMGTLGEYAHSNLANPCNSEKSKVRNFKKLDLCKWVNSVTESPLLRQWRISNSESFFFKLSFLRNHKFLQKWFVLFWQQKVSY